MTDFTPAIISSLAPMTVTPQGGYQETLATEMVGVTFGIMQTIHHHSGNVFPTLVVVPGADRRVRVSMPFYQALANFGLALTPCSEVAFYLSVFEDYNRQDGDVHQKISLTDGCTCAAQITSWSVNVDGIVMCQVDFLFLSTDGAVDPIIITDDQPLPDISGTPQLHTLGPVSFNGEIVPGVTSSGGNIGSSPNLLRTDGDFFGRTAARVSSDPVITLVHSDPVTTDDVLSSLGTYIDPSVIVYFKSYDSTTGLSSDENGISIEIENGRVHPHGPDANQGTIATQGIDVIGISADGGSNPFSVSVGVDVPTPP